jgi:very-short-patch-repair endonuclease
VEIPEPDWFLDNVLATAGRDRRVLGPASDWQRSWREEFSRLQIVRDGATETVLPLAATQGYVLSRAQAMAAGVPPSTVRRLVRRGSWQRVRYGVLAIVGTDGGSGLIEQRRRHALDAAAGALIRPDHVVSARSAAVLHGLPVRRLPESAELTARPVRSGGRTAALLVREAALPARQVTDWFGVPTTSVARTVADLSRHDPRDGGMAADAALRESLTTRRELSGVIDGCAGWPGVRSARLIRDLADPRAESPLESLVRLEIRTSQLPPPDLQVEIRVAGRTYRVDFLWRRQRLVLEADGRGKYTGDELWAEKRRELALTRAGYRVERVVWADLGRGWPAVAARLRSVLAASPPR